MCGFLVLDKPAGLTSHGCVSAVRRAYHLRRVGHGGTLDPAVTGVLPIAVGSATRLLPYLRSDKTYRGLVQLGIRTSSDDLEGTLLEQRDPPALSSADLEHALAEFRGPILQRPPDVSAVHVDGERAYSRARRGEVLNLARRPVTIHRLELLGWDPGSGQLDLEIRCSAGTYIRALARDLGERLGCGAALARLRRTESLGFDLGGAVTLERLAESPAPQLLDPLLPLVHLRRRHLSDTELPAWRCGRSLPVVPDAFPSGSLAEVGGAATASPQLACQPMSLSEAPSEARPGADSPGSPLAMIGPDGRLAGIAAADQDGFLRPRVVLDAAG